MAREKDKEIADLLDIEVIQQWVTNSFEKVLEVQLPLAVSTVSRLRRVHPEKSPEQLIRFLNKTYIGVVAGSGAGVGIAAALPNGVVQIPVALTDQVGILEASVLYVLTLAEIYGIDVEDFERRRFLVMTVLLGDSGTKAVTQALGKKTVPYWSRKIIDAIPTQAITKVNKVLGPRFITKYGAKQGVLVLGKQLPFMLGAVVGAGGNAVFGYVVIRSTSRLLGAPPENWGHFPAYIDEVVDAPVMDKLPTGQRSSSGF